MPRLARLVLSLVLVLPITDCTLGEPAGKHLDRLIRLYLDFDWETRPEQATAQGIYLFNSRLGPTGAEDFKAQAGQLRKFFAELKAIDPNGLDLDRQVDQRLLESILRVRLAELEEVRAWERDPSFYIPFEGLNLLITERFASPAIRANQLVERLGEVPRVFADGKKNLRNPPRLLTEIAIGTARNMMAFYRETIPKFAARAPQQKKQVLSAASRAGDAQEDFVRFLEEDLLPLSNGSPAVGRRIYDFYLAEQHMLDEDADSLLAKGRREFDEIESQLEATARQIDPQKTWQQITEEIRDRHPSRDGLLVAYCDEIQRSKAHVKALGLVTLPKREAVSCQHTPPAQRAFSPFGDFRPPVPFSEEKVGQLLLHPVPEGLAASDEERLLRAHDYTWISVIAPHEAYPGHHVQALKAQENPRLLRKVSSSPLFSEGWGLYCEELAYETGFFEDPLLTRLTQLRLRLWRAARIILDVQLHTGGIDYDQARRFLVEKIRFEKSAAVGEVNIYLRRPTYVVSYLIGFKEIMKLREEFRRSKGERFSLLDFHDRLLTQGSMPFPLMRLLLFRDDGS